MTALIIDYQSECICIQNSNMALFNFNNILFNKFRKCTADGF